MRDLMPGVRVYCEEALPPHLPRLMLTRGAVEVSGAPIAGTHFRTPAVVPVQDFRPLRLEEQAQVLLTAEQAASAAPAETLVVLRMPPEVLAPFERLGLRGAESLERCEHLLHSPAQGEALEEAALALWPYIADPTGFRVLGICTQAPDMLGTTTHIDERGHATFSGLHIDDWDARSIGDRQGCGRQMSINLGRCDRFLVFSPLPVAAIAARLGRDPHTEPGRYTELCVDFLRQHPGHPLLKVRVRPGEAYIAPTENVIHDGSTRGSDAPDITLNVRGRLRSLPDLQP